MIRSVWLEPAASGTSSTRSSAPAPPPRSRVSTCPTASGAPSSHTPVMVWRRSNIGRPAAGPDDEGERRVTARGAGRTVEGQARIDRRDVDGNGGLPIEAHRRRSQVEVRGHGLPPASGSPARLGRALGACRCRPVTPRTRAVAGARAVSIGPRFASLLRSGRRSAKPSSTRACTAAARRRHVEPRAPRRRRRPLERHQPAARLAR